MTITEFLEARIAEDEALANAATPGPWKWWNLEGVDQGWSDNGPNLDSSQGEWKTCPYFCKWTEPSDTHRGEVGKPGHEHLVTEQVIGSWGHDANGINVALADATHISVHDPSRVLAECAAKRAIIAGRARIDRSANDDEWSMGYSDANYEAISALAAVYASHTDYREEWAL